jgi:hypothetical protein
MIRFYSKSSFHQLIARKSFFTPLTLDAIHRVSVGEIHRWRGCSQPPRAVVALKGAAMLALTNHLIPDLRQNQAPGAVCVLCDDVCVLSHAFQASK